MVCQVNSFVFVWCNQAKLNELLCMYVNDFIFGGIQIFKNNVIATIERFFTHGAEYCGAFEYLVVNINQLSTEIILDYSD